MALDAMAGCAGVAAMNRRRDFGPRQILAICLAIALGSQTARASGRIDGVWEGVYSCAQGNTGLSLFVSGWASGPLKAMFLFYPTPDNPTVPVGCFKMSGTYDADTGRVAFRAGDWLSRPFGFVTVDLSGAVDARLTYMSGAVDGPGCDRFALSHVPAASLSVPAACRPALDVMASAGG